MSEPILEPTSQMARAVEQAMQPNLTDIQPVDLYCKTCCQKTGATGLLWPAGLLEIWPGDLIVIESHHASHEGANHG